MDPITEAITLRGIIKPYDDAVTELASAYNGYNYAVGNNGLTNWSANDILREMYLTGELNASEYKSGLKTIKSIDEATGSTLWIDNKSWTMMGTAFGLLGNQDQKQAVKLYNKMTAFALTNADRYTNRATYDNVLGALNGQVTAPQYVKDPDLFSEEFNPDKIDVDDLHLWTNQEIADLHNVNYDPNYYYDLVKKGVDAKVALANSQIAQADTAAGLQDEINKAAYLDTIRNTKSDAIEKGASAGARAANELLNNVNALQTYAGNRSGVATNNQSIIETPLRDAASYKTTANEYFDSLAQSLMGTGSSYYASDVQKRGQQMLTNAEMYRAAADELNARVQANANMQAAQAQANANINVANANANSYINDLIKIYNTAYRANNSNATAAYNDFANIVANQYFNSGTGTSFLDYITTNKN